MIFSKYNFLYESKHGYLLYNSASNAFIELDKNSFDKLKQIENNPSLFDELGDRSKEKLIAAKVFVEDDNQFFYNKRMNFYFNTFDSANLGLAIAPTTHCNFACSYCYEGNHKPLYMTEEIEKQVITFIKEHNRIKHLNLTWYGGEPLLGFDSIKRLIRDISKIPNLMLGQHTMTSNGYLLSKEKSMFFKDFPLTCIQITIDGNKESHDSRRTLSPHKEPTYNVIIKNIEEFIKLNPDTRVAIRANLDHSNAETFIEVYSELSEKWKGENVIVYPAFVKDFSSIYKKKNDNNFAVNGCRDLCFTASEKMCFFESLYTKYGLNVNFAPEYVYSEQTDPSFLKLTPLLEGH
ncbi:MAG: radical SAM protein [Bacteroidales bacterium]|nr:radical SAM protein [Bacteroidales bacterium]